MIDGQAFGAPVPLQGGSATSSLTSTLGIGGHTVAADYSGDGNYRGGTGTLLQTVQNNTTTTLTSSANPAPSGQPITYTATVSPVLPSVSVPTGTVQFRFEGDALGDPVPLVGGIAVSAPVSGISPGDHAITAIYSGDAAFAGSIGSLTQTVHDN
jgi:hypothetical protein